MICTVEQCDRRTEARGWCDKHYKRWRRYGDPLYVRQMKDGSLEDRLRHTGWSEDEGCWIWNGSKQPFGHGQLSYQGRILLAHRAAYMVWVGPIPDGLVVMHTCDVPPCINPEHLRCDTQYENMMNMKQKGRGRGRNSAPLLREKGWPRR